MFRTLLLGLVVGLSLPMLGFSQESELFDDPEVEAAAEALRKQHVVVVQRPVRELRTITEIRYCRYGLFGRKTRAVRVQRQIIVQTLSSEIASNLDDGIGWDNIGDPRLGFATLKYPVKMLPRAAGARGSKINSAAERVLKEGANTVANFGVLDKALMRTPLKLPGPPRARELVQVKARVADPDNDSATIEVKVQERDAAGEPIANAMKLNTRAGDIAKLIEAELNK